MKIAIKQPYFMPYMGYFQLIKSVDVFVIYNDVNYYKGGFINRNNILINGKSSILTIPVKKASPTKLICEVEIDRNSKKFKSLLKTIYLSYKRAPYFDEVYLMICSIINSSFKYISDFNYNSISIISKYMNIRTKLIASSKRFPDSKGIGREKRLIEICNQLNTDIYISELAGKKIYKEKHFKSEGIDFAYIVPILSDYKQFVENFVPSLSIIDVLMFNSVQVINDMIDKYKII